MKKIDFKKELKHLYCPSAKEINLVDVPPMNFVMIDGSGDPNTAQGYRDAIEVLYSISYTIKFTVRKDQGIDYGVMPLEGLWWTDDMASFSATNKNIWKWTSMVMQPEYVTHDLFKIALQQIEKKKDLPALSRAKFQSFHEGKSAQIMFIGPYSAEGPTIEKIHDFIRGQGDTFDGLIQKHHEIYLSDPRRTVPEKLKTIIRQPIKSMLDKSR
ncbi:GyrI-like domain-containing protein [Chloroflexota bacterium]